MDWRLAATLCAVMYGVGTFFLAKATHVHGPKIASLMQVVCYIVLLAVMRLSVSDLQRVTRESFTYGMAAASLFVAGSYLIFMGSSLFPAKTSLIEALVTTGLLLSTLLIHNMIGAMSPWQWTGIVLVTAGAVIIQLSP